MTKHVQVIAPFDICLIMWLKTLCVPLFITFICLSTSCFGSYREDPFHSDVRQTHVYSRPTTYNKQDNVNPINNNEVWSRIDRVTLKVINVDDFGAKANGFDDSQAFKEAWELACNSSQGAIVVVPKNKIYHLKPIDFFGPCNSPLIVNIHGTIKATVHHSDYKAHGRRRWLYFANVQNLRVEGGGIINGNGRTWWQKSCKINIAIALTFSQCSNLRVAGLRIRNAQQMHLSFNKCVNVKALNLSVTAPGNSPNTDGIHVSETHNIHIKNCVIKTGDDCISVVSGSQNVRATDITCGPGHGISIGSLGARNSAAYVSNVIVNRATISGTTNGVRIKTWQGGSGYAKNIKFQNIMVHNVSNPIIIDQNYCDHHKSPCPCKVSAVQVSNVIYENIRGTSASNVAVKFNCSRRFPCREIFLQNVAITSSKEDKEHTAEASCTNIRLSYRGNVFPPC
ncbi:polygalacturonase QRT2 isoform X2 [Gossypium hirsutum]|uniref:Polygalacturonase QRT2 isoform X2 n=1 Tax=Gossypium hirsutum TaxID=3635 RepID=A0ABM3AL93_GOSHI|nr:polygalacturonase QRT2-like isoform X2 [Gossypium hirsutum]